jgi:cytochrome o ubiquinol oxidase subunit 2
MKRKPGFMLLALAMLCLVPLLGGCSDLILFNPKGPIGDSERTLILVAFALMMIVVIPVIVMSIWFPLKYRETNTKADYQPNWDYSKRIEIVMWVIPFIIVSILATILWFETHRLDPYKPIESDAKPLQVEVVSLDWKWLFIYPEHNIAVVNQFVFPEKIPLNFLITSDTVMTSFFIPQLGSQIYAMAGMKTRLHLMADEQGEFLGHNQQFSGAGFPDMNFKAKATSRQDFDSWVQKVKESPNKLDLARFDELRKPGVSDSPIYFSSVDPGLLDHIVNTYNPKAHGSDAPGRKAVPSPHTSHGY